MTANNITVINANNTFQDWYQATALHATLLNTVVVTTDNQPTTGNAVVNGSIQSVTAYANTIMGGTIGLPGILTVASNTTFTETISTNNINFGGSNNNVGLAANIHIVGANTTNYIVVANTTTNRLRFIPGTTLESISTLGTTGSILYTTNTNTWAESTITAAGRALLDDANNSVQRTTLGLTIGTNVQAYDAGLQSISGLTTAANKLIYTTASDVYTTTDLSAFGRTLIDDANNSVARSTLGVVIGTDVQAQSPTLQSISPLGTVGNRYVYTTAGNTWTEAYISPSAIEMLANNDVGGYIVAQTGSGSMSTQNSNSVAITGGSITGITDIAVADGGTGSSNTAGARANLGLAIGTNVQAYSAILAGTTESFTTALKTNYDTAFAWGNHASAGYLAASSYTAADVLAKIKTVDGAASGLDADLLDGLNATTAATGSTIMSRSIDGDSDVRYLNSQYVNMSHVASVRSTDSVFYSSNDAYVRKNTAAGFRTSLDVYSKAEAVSAASYTAADVKAKLLTVDGSGSSVDADLLDGQHGSFYQSATNLNAGTLNDARLPTRLGALAATITDWNTAEINGWYMGSGVLNAPDTGWWLGIVTAHNGIWTIQELYNFSSANPMKKIRFQNNGTWGSWKNAVVSDTEALTLAEQGEIRGNIGADVLGGFRNKIINGNFDVWQRGVSYTGGGYGCADRWATYSLGSTKTASRQEFALGQTDVPGNPEYYMRTVVSSVAGAGNYVWNSQFVEDVSTLSGKWVTVTFWAKADANKNVAMYLQHYFGSGGSPSASVEFGAQKFALTTAWQKFSVAVNIPSVAGKVIGTNGNDCLSVTFVFDAGSNWNARTATLGQQSGTFDIARVSLVDGDATAETDPFTPRHIQQEIALCERYYEKKPYQVQGWFYVYNGGVAYNSVYYNTEKRTTPAMTLTTSSVIGCTGPTLNEANKDGFSVAFTGTVTTGGSPYGIYSWTADAEL